jgi:hypothetical protein
MVACLVIGQKDLAALGGPFDRAAELARKPEHERLLGIERTLCAEAAAHIGRHHTQLVLRQLQHEGSDQKSMDVWRLARGVECVFAGATVEFAGGGARLHRV